MSGLRPWRKVTLQVISTERWITTAGEDIADGSLAQVGGHGAWDKDQAMQVSKKGLVLKPIQGDARGQREAEFFKTVSNSTDPAVRAFLEFMPHFHGISKRKKSDGATGEFIMMENLTNNLSKPCIMDIKIGARTWGPDASEAKRKQQDASYAATKTAFGFSVPGLSSFKGENKDCTVSKAKDYGKQLNAENIHEMLELYLDISTNPEIARKIAGVFVEKLKKIQSLFETQRSFHFFASSLLFVYDAEAVQNNIDTEELNNLVNLKMIDFAHVWPAEGEIDNNYLRGVTSLIQLFSGV